MPAFDAATNLGNTSGATLTASHTCTGSNRALFVGVGSGGSAGDFCTGVTYNGVAMTLVRKRADANTVFTYLFALMNPASGANNVVISQSSSVSMYGLASSYTAANATGNPSASNDNSASAATSLTTSVTTVDDNSWTILAGWNDVGTIAAGTGSTQRVLGNFSFFGLFDSNGAITPAGATSMQVTAPSSHMTGIIAALSPVSAGGTRPVKMAGAWGGYAGESGGFAG